MAKQIIVLDQNVADAGSFAMRVVFWVPQSPAVPQPGITASAWNGASAADIQALQQGTILEVVKSFNFPNATPAATMKSTLNSAYTALVAALPAKRQFYGVFFDSVSGWSA